MKGCGQKWKPEDPLDSLYSHLRVNFGGGADSTCLWIWRGKWDEKRKSETQVSGFSNSVFTSSLPFFFFFFSFLLPSSFPLPCSHCNRMWHIPYQPQVHSSSSVNLEVTNSRNRSWSSHTGAKPHTSCCLPPGISVHIITLFTGVPRRSFYSPNAASLCLSSVS